MRNLTMLMDFYELTMANGYFVTGNKDKVAVFDMFYRTNPDGGGFVISAGLQMLIDYVKNLKCTDDVTHKYCYHCRYCTKIIPKT